MSFDTFIAHCPCCGEKLSLQTEDCQEYDRSCFHRSCWEKMVEDKTPVQDKLLKEAKKILDQTIERDSALYHLRKWKTDNPNEFNRIMECENPAEAWLVDVGCLPVPKLSTQKLNQLLWQIVGEG